MKNGGYSEVTLGPGTLIGLQNWVCSTSWCLQTQPIRAIWAYPGLSGPIWAYLGLSGPIWAYPGVSGPIWAYLGLSGAIWAFMVISGAVSGYLGLTGPGKMMVLVLGPLFRT